VALFAEEDLVIAAPLLRAAALEEHEWVGMLPNMTPAGRSVLRHRRDLQPSVMRALEAYGPIDFVLPMSDAADVAAAAAVDADGEGFSIDWTIVIDSRPDPAVVGPLSALTIAASAAPEQPRPAFEPNPDQSFVSFASVAFGLPVVMKALSQQDGGGDAPEHAADDAPLPEVPVNAPLPLQPDARADPPLVANDTEQVTPRGPFQIADLVARIDAFQRHREEGGPAGGVSRLKVQYITQGGLRPPVFVLFTSGGNKAGLHFSYTRYIENRLRDAFEFFATPIRLKEKHKMAKKKASGRG